MSMRIYIVLPLGNLLRVEAFSRLKCVTKYFVSFSFSLTLSHCVSVSIYYCCWKNKTSVFVLGKYKLNGIHIFHSRSLACSLSFSLWFVLCCCDLPYVSTTFIFFQLFLTSSSQNLLIATSFRTFNGGISNYLRRIGSISAQQNHCFACVRM